MNIIEKNMKHLNEREKQFTSSSYKSIIPVDWHDEKPEQGNWA